MSSILGEKIKVSVFGESHGAAIGVVIDSPPVNIKLDEAFILAQMARRAPGLDATATKRKEADLPEIISGIKDGVTTGAPLTAIIKNSNTISKDYDELKALPRPSHSDYAAYVHYKGFNDISGGGHFSGRLTAPLVFAGAVLRLFLKEKGIEIGGHITKIGNVTEERFNPVTIAGKELAELNKKSFGVIHTETEEKMREEIEGYKANGDSIGGEIEIAVTGLPAGLGAPMFDGVENNIAKAVFGVPAIKGIEFGAGFDFAALSGSKANDQMEYKEGAVVTKTNNCGGIVGGITNAMPLIFRVAVKPTPSISLPQATVNLKTKQNAELVIKGRHDPCIVPRALPAVEAVTAIAIANLLGEAEL